MQTNPIKHFMISLYGLYLKETTRIFRIFNQSVIAPFIEGIMMIFIINAVKNHSFLFSDKESLTFLMSATIGTTLIKNIFSNSSSVIVISRNTGAFYDYISPPIYSIQIVLSLMIAGFIRAILILAMFLGSIKFLMKSSNIAMTGSPISLQDLMFLISIVLLIACIFSSIGLALGIYFPDFEKMHSINSYIIGPLSMFSGTFYPISLMPSVIYKTAIFNPFFCGIDLIKFCFTKHVEINLRSEIISLCITSIIIILFTNVIVRKSMRNSLQ